LGGPATLWSTWTDQQVEDQDMARVAEASMPERMTPEELALLRKMAAARNVELRYKLGVYFRAHPELGEPGEFAPWLGMAAQNGSPRRPAAGAAPRIGTR
jgi:hypothetical protein